MRTAEFLLFCIKKQPSFVLFDNHSMEILHVELTLSQMYYLISLYTTFYVCFSLIRLTKIIIQSLMVVWCKGL